MHQKFGVKLKEMLKQYSQYPKTSIYQHSLKPLGELKERTKESLGNVTQESQLSEMRKGQLFEFW